MTMRSNVPAGHWARLLALIRCEENDGIFCNVNFMTEADLIQQDRALASHSNASDTFGAASKVGSP
jgi:hypothetical protein